MDTTTEDVDHFTNINFKGTLFLTQTIAKKMIVTKTIPKLANGTSKITISIFDGKTKKEVVINESEVRVEGRTSGEWVALGEYVLSAGNKSYVEISNKKADGIVAADAILFVPQFK